MYQSFLSINNKIAKFFTKGEKEKALTSLQKTASISGLTAEDDAFFELCREEFEQQAIIDFDFREAMVLTQIRYLLEPDELAEIEQRYFNCSQDIKEKMLSQMEQTLEDNKIEDMVEMELNNFVMKFEQGAEFEQPYMDFIENDLNYRSAADEEDEMDIEEYIIDPEGQKECYNAAHNVAKG